MGIYDEMLSALSQELDEIGQGEIVYIEAGATTGDDWNPTIGDPTHHRTRGVGRGVQQKYVDGTTVLSTDLQFLIEPFGLTPDTEDQLMVDDKIMQIVAVMQTPAAGTPVAWRLFVRS